MLTTGSPPTLHRYLRVISSDVRENNERGCMCMRDGLGAGGCSFSASFTSLRVCHESLLVAWYPYAVGKRRSKSLWAEALYDSHPFLTRGTIRDVLPKGLIRGSRRRRGQIFGVAFARSLTPLKATPQISSRAKALAYSFCVRLPPQSSHLVLIFPSHRVPCHASHIILMLFPRVIVISVR